MSNQWRTARVLTVLMAGLCATTAHAREMGVRGDEASPSCDMSSAGPWIQAWFDAWELVAKEVLRLERAVAPDVVFFDRRCVWTTSEITAPASTAVAGPALLGERLSWRAGPHDGSITMPDGERIPVGLLSFAAPGGRAGSFLVMPAPQFWKEAGVESKAFGLEKLITAVFVHEFSHTRQVEGFQRVVAPIEEKLGPAEGLSDDTIQNRFADEPGYRTAFEAERDELFEAAIAPSCAQARAAAQRALELVRTRQDRWFVQDNAMFRTLDDAFLSFEGAGQFAAYGWLIHPQGGGIERSVASDGLRRGGKFWSQDEGLGLFLALDQLLPDWPSYAYKVPADGAVSLLKRAVAQPETSGCVH